MLRPYKPSISASRFTVTAWQTADNFADAREKSYSAENEREPGPRVQPVIEEITNRGSNDDRANESTRQLKRQGES